MNRVRPSVEVEIDRDADPACNGDAILDLRVERPLACGLDRGAIQDNNMMYGISAKYKGNNGHMLQINIESIAEDKDLTQGYQAEFGRYAGGDGDQGYDVGPAVLGGRSTVAVERCPRRESNSHEVALGGF